MTSSNHTMGVYWRVNNFDLIRLLAALQVVLCHSVLYLDLHFGVLFDHFMHVLDYFPGVPIFFVTSGFLISSSLRRHPGLRNYFRNRLLRIYPALYLSFFLTVGLLAALGYLTWNVVSDPQFALWIFTQLTIAPFYDIPRLIGFGHGDINCSLWTIPVELQFYIVLPLLMFSISK